LSPAAPHGAAGWRVQLALAIIYANF